MRRIVVTGIGVVSPAGNTLKKAWQSVRAGKSGIGGITRFDASSLKWKTAGELIGFRPGDFLTEKEIRRFDPFVHFAYAAASMAVEDSGLSQRQLSKAGVIIGSGRGGITSLEAGMSERPSAYMMSGSTVSMASSFIAGKLGIKGSVLGISTACSSGSHAIGEAMRLIKHGEAEIVLAGGAEAPICKLCIEGYGISGALSKKGVSRPFDAKRDGFILSEGASVLVLETLESAIKRGSKIYGDIAGYGNSSDAFHQTAPDKAGQVRAMKAALKEAAMRPPQVDLISAHATSTKVGDKTEAESIREVFGDKIPVAAFKSMTGHMLGASGAFEAAMALMCIGEGVTPRIISLDEPEGDINFVRKTICRPVRAVSINSFGFGGVNAVLIIKKI